MQFMHSIIHFRLNLIFYYIYCVTEPCLSGVYIGTVPQCRRSAVPGTYYVNLVPVNLVPGTIYAVYSYYYA
jgi:hypothetical protein